DAGDLATGFANTLFNFDLAHFGTWFSIHEVSHMPECLISAAIGCAVVFVVSFRRERGTDVVSHGLSVNFVLRVVAYVACGYLVLSSFFLAESGGGFLYANF
ncbi:MAG: MBOAT family protein, partial [Eggerthellaceae bacterium]|nr:MBOAT family protein [Eggerthellaceae bacterium]